MKKKFTYYKMQGGKHTRADIEDAIDKLKNHPEIPLDEILGNVFDEISTVDEDEACSIVKENPERTIVKVDVERGEGEK